MTHLIALLLFVAGTGAAVLVSVIAHKAGRRGPAIQAALVAVAWSALYFTGVLGGAVSVVLFAVHMAVLLGVLTVVAAIGVLGWRVRKALRHRAAPDPAT